MSPGEHDRTPTVRGRLTEDRVPHLVALTGPKVGTVHPLTIPEMLVGREDADLCLSDPGVSRRHARLRLVEDQVVVEDLASTNGTFIGIERVKDRAVAGDGDNIAFGVDSRFRLTYIPAASAPSDSLGKDPKPSRPTPRRFTREFLVGLLRVEYAYARRHGSPLSLVFFRSDAAAGVAVAENDERPSEESLSRLATAIDIAIRTEDSLARSSADEFTVLVRGDAEAATRMAERVVARIGTHDDISGPAAGWGTVTAVVLPISPTKGDRGLDPDPEPERILVAARAAAAPTMAAVSNRVVRLNPLVV